MKHTHMVAGGGGGGGGSLDIAKSLVWRPYVFKA